MCWSLLGLKSLKRTKHGQFDSILILVICQFSLFLVQFFPSTDFV